MPQVHTVLLFVDKRDILSMMYVCLLYIVVYIGGTFDMFARNY